MNLLPAEQYKPPYHVVASSSSSGTMKSRLDSLYTAFNNLTADEKMRSAIVINGANLLRNNGASYFTRSLVSDTGLTVFNLFIDNNASSYTAMKCWADGSGANANKNIITDNSSATTGGVLQLVVLD